MCSRACLGLVLAANLLKGRCLGQQADEACQEEAAPSAVLLLQTKSRIEVPEGTVLIEPAPVSSAGSQRMQALFVAVMSRRQSFGERGVLREAMRHLPSIHAVRFVVCDGGADAQHDGSSALLSEEGAKFRDLLLLPCAEGYGGGNLTLKTALTLERFVRDFGDKAWLVKVDDDTWVSWERLQRWLAPFGEGVAARGSSVYAGKFPASFRVVRDPTSLWYQPVAGYPNATYPLGYMGAFYVLSKPLVSDIVQRGWEKEPPALLQEDRAVALWVDRVRQRGTPVSFMTLPGIRGYTEDSYRRRGEYPSQYPESAAEILAARTGSFGGQKLVFHHRLSPSTILCLANLEAENRSDAPVDPCFKPAA